MSPELNALVADLKAQRNMFADRSAELAGKLAVKDAEIASLKAEKAAAAEAEAKKAE